MFFTSSWSRWLPGLAGLLALALLLVLASGAIAALLIDPDLPVGTATHVVGEHIVDDPALEVITLSTVPPTLEPSTPAAIGVADGHIPDGDVLSPYDVEHPAIANLDPDLLAAIQQATIDANAEGIEMVVNSGWRSERYQQALLDEAIVTYGSEEAARKWVNTPDRSTHVTGEGVDIGYTDADYWLIEHGYRYGLCQTYANEIWHFELADEPGNACPPPLPDANEPAPAETD